jgi:hypothetical protein
MTTRDDAQTARRAAAAATCDELAPWLPYVAGADRRRFPDLLIGDTKVDVNAPLALIEVEVAAQLRLLTRLHTVGLLRTDGSRPGRVG